MRFGLDPMKRALVVAGLLAQPASQADPFTAISYGVWQHGATADQLTARQRNWVVEDLAREIGNTAAPGCEDRPLA